MKRTIKVKHFIDSLNLASLNTSTNEEIVIDTSQLNRPGLQLCGFFDYFTSSRVQVIGKAEMTYLYNLDESTRRMRVDQYFSYAIPCVIIGRDLMPPPDFIELAKEHNIPLFMSPLPTGKISHNIITFLDDELAPCIAKHGGLMDIHGIGVFITGESGIGKSETMLELIKRGHRLVADDVVEMRRITDNKLIGRHRTSFVI